MHHEIVTTSNKCSVEVGRDYEIISPESKSVISCKVINPTLRVTLQTERKLAIGDTVSLRVVAVLGKITGRVIRKVIFRKKQELRCVAVVSSEFDGGYSLKVINNQIAV